MSGGCNFSLHLCPGGATSKITRWSVLLPCNSQIKNMSRLNHAQSQHTPICMLLMIIQVPDGTGMYLNICMHSELAIHNGYMMPSTSTILDISFRSNIKYVSVIWIKSHSSSMSHVTKFQFPRPPRRVQLPNFKEGATS
jgi:hypothetical protein